MVTLRRGFSLVELLVTLAILSAFVLIIVALERGALNLVRETNPSRVALTDLDPVIARFGRDVLDARGYWPNNRELDGYAQDETTLILRLPPGSEADAVVWAFSNEGASRITYTGSAPSSEWTWSGAAEWSISSFEGRWVRLRASVEDRPLMDRIWRPRAH